MAYSDLIVTPAVVSITESGNQFTITDATGTWDPDNPTVTPGGYAPSGDETATRPTFAQTKRFWCFQKTPFNDEQNISAPFLPETQPQSDPFFSICPLLDEFGEPLPQATYRGVLFVVPVATDLDALRDSIITDGVDFWILSIQETGAVGELAILVQQENINCVNQSRRVAVNSLLNGGCCTDMFNQKNAELQGITSTMGTFPSYEIVSVPGEALYVEGQAQIEELEETCLESPCCDTC